MPPIPLALPSSQFPILRIGLTLNGQYDKMDRYYSTNEIEINAVLHVKFLGSRKVAWLIITRLFLFLITMNESAR